MNIYTYIYIHKNVYLCGSEAHRAIATVRTGSEGDRHGISGRWKKKNMLQNISGRQLSAS